LKEAIKNGRKKDYIKERKEGNRDERRGTKKKMRKGKQERKHIIKK